MDQKIDNQVQSESSEQKAINGVVRHNIEIYWQNIEVVVDYHVDQKLFKLYNNEKLIAEIPGDKMKDMGNDIDNMLKLSEQTHRFICDEEIEMAVNGDQNMQYFVFSDWLNDPEKKENFLQILKIDNLEKNFPKKK